MVKSRHLSDPFFQLHRDFFSGFGRSSRLEGTENCCYLTRVMKSVSLVRLVLIIVAIICGFNAIEAICASLPQLLWVMTQSRAIDSEGIMFRSVIYAVIYLAAFFLVIQYSAPIADFIEKNRGHQPDKITATIRRFDLFYILLLSISAVALLRDLPVLLVEIYDRFRASVARKPDMNEETFTFRKTAIRFVLAMLVLLFARPLSQRLSRLTGEDHPIITTNKESENV